MIDLVSREVPASIQCVLCAKYEYEDIIEDCVREAVNKAVKKGGWYISLTSGTHAKNIYFWTIFKIISAHAWWSQISTKTGLRRVV